MRRAIERRPVYGEAHYNLGNALQAAGDLPGAIAAFRQAIALEPDLAAPHFNLGIALLKTGAAADAAAFFRGALRLRPDFAEAEFNLGNALLEQGDAAEAAASFERALSLTPGWVAACCNLGIARQRQGRLEAARAAYAAALARRTRPAFRASSTASRPMPPASYGSISKRFAAASPSPPSGRWPFSLNRSLHLSAVIPAKAGIQGPHALQLAAYA